MARILYFELAICIFIVLYSQAASDCQEGKSWRYGSETCCDGESYNLGDEDIELLEACSVEPENKSLSCIDSAWTAYECIVRNGVGSDQVDINSYIDMMSTNLSESKRERIRELASKSSLAKNSSLETNLATLKLYRTEYFRAEFEVCKFERYLEMMGENMTNETLKEFWIENWEPSTKCAGAKVPQFLIDYSHNYVVNANIEAACRSDIVSRYNLTWGHPLDSPISDLCYFVSLGVISLEHVESENFIQVFHDVLPKYWSKVVKERGYAHMLEYISRRYLVDTNMNVTSAVSGIRSRFQKTHANTPAVSDPGDGAIHFEEKAFVGVAITKAGLRVMREFCRSPPNVTDVTGF